MIRLDGVRLLLKRRGRGGRRGEGGGGKEMKRGRRGEEGVRIIKEAASVSVWDKRFMYINHD